MKKFSIVSLQQEHIPEIVAAFQNLGWNKSAELYEQYLQEQKTGQRDVWIAFTNESLFAGYVTLAWKSQYPFFVHQNIPEVMDLIVLPQFRNQGLGGLLLQTAEKKAATKVDYIGLAVGLTADYGSAQRLYVKRGYIPDGHGITYNYRPAVHGSTLFADDDLALWLVKSLVNEGFLEGF